MNTRKIGNIRTTRSRTGQLGLTSSFSALAAALVLSGACEGLDSLDPVAEAATDPSPQVTTEKAALALAINDTGHPHAAHTRCPDGVPAALDPPADATIAFSFAAEGVQIYTCTAAAPAVPPAPTPPPSFVLKAPHAVLFEGPQPRLIHFAGPSWEALDGSLVTGTKLASAPAPDPTAIPWLLLKAATHAGTGVLANVTFIQRLGTVGGVAPTAGCDDAHLGTEVLVPYRSTYFFYVPAAAGGRVRQCSSR